MTVSNFETSGHVTEHDRWEPTSDKNTYSFQVFFSLSGAGFTRNYSTYVIADVPAGKKPISTRAHLHMNTVAATAAIEHIKNVFDTQGPQAASELRRLDLRGRL